MSWDQMKTDAIELWDAFKECSVQKKILTIIWAVPVVGVMQVFRIGFVSCVYLLTLDKHLVRQAWRDTQ